MKTHNIEIRHQIRHKKEQITAIMRGTSYDLTTDELRARITFVVEILKELDRLELEHTS